MGGAAHAKGLTVEETAKLTRGVTLLSVAVAATLIVVKAIAWQVSGSVAVLASLADSGLDLVASLVTFFAVRYAAEPPDAEHRYGHGKAEAFASLAQAGLVLLSAALVAREAVARMIDPQPLERESWGMGVMLISLVLTSLLIVAQSRVLKRTGSVAVSGDRAHYFSDLASNLMALAGIAAAAFLDLPVFDAIAGLLVAAWLVWGAYQVFAESSRHLMDHELPEEAREDIRRLIAASPGVIGVHQVRTRASGPSIHIQAHVDLDPNITLLQAHEILDRAEASVLAAYPAADIILHPDPHGLAEEHAQEFDAQEVDGRVEAAG
jgi:cation diffusion facilitator family transporter